MRARNDETCELRLAVARWCSWFEDATTGTSAYSLWLLPRSQYLLCTCFSSVQRIFALVKRLSGTAATGREENQRREMTMLGACRVTVQGGRFRCFCTGSHLVHLSSSNDLCRKCTGCDHLLAEHSNFPGSFYCFYCISFDRC